MNKPKTRNAEIVVQEMDNEILIYDLKDNKAFCLNETSAIIYQLCDGRKSVAEISQILTKRLNQPMTEDIIWLALDGFKKDNLLEKNDQFAINFNGLSRRQVIKKIGLGSLVALPVIASVIAPQAVQAASCVNPGGATPGTVVNPCNFAGLCAGVLTSQCCSGMTTFTINGCSAPNPTAGSCACA